MLVRACEKTSINGWRNVTLINSSAEEAQIPEQLDAVLFSFAHDVLQSPPALENVMHYVKPSGRVVSAGLKWAAWWAAPINLGVWYLARKYATTFEGYAQPWSHLAGFVSIWMSSR